MNTTKSQETLSVWHPLTTARLEKPKQLLEPLLHRLTVPLSSAHIQPGAQKDHAVVESNVRAHDPEISPAVLVGDRETRGPLLTGGEPAISAHAVSQRLDVSTCLCHEPTGVGVACLLGGDRENDQLVRLAVYREVVHKRSNETLQQVRERRRMVRPAPEVWQFARKDEDTAEAPQTGRAA